MSRSGKDIPSGGTDKTDKTLPTRKIYPPDEPTKLTKPSEESVEERLSWYGAYFGEGKTREHFTPEEIDRLAEEVTIGMWRYMYPHVTNDQIRRSIRRRNPDSLGPEKRKNIARLVKAYHSEIHPTTLEWFLDAINEINFPLTEGEEDYRRRQKAAKENFEKILEYSDHLVSELEKYFASHACAPTSASFPSDPVAWGEESNSVFLHAMETWKHVLELKKQMASWPDKCSPPFKVPLKGSQERVKVFQVAVLLSRLSLPDQDGNRLSINKGGSPTLFQSIIRTLWPEIKDGSIEGALTLFKKASSTLSKLSELAPELFGPFDPN